MNVRHETYKRAAYWVQSDNNYIETARKFGVTDGAVRKHVKKAMMALGWEGGSTKDLHAWVEKHRDDIYTELVRRMRAKTGMPLEKRYQKSRQK